MPGLMLRHLRRACIGPLLRPSPRCTRPYSLGNAFVPSQEQAAIVEQCRTKNVTVSARPGVGKTATAEALVQANPDVPIAVVTYSKRLQLHTQQRLDRYPHADAFTFHGLASRLFGGVVHNDSLLRDLRKNNAVPSWMRMPQYEYVVLDELQDLTDDLYWVTNTFISAVTRATGRAPQILALGDARQAIYEFRGADARFLDLSPTVFSVVSPYEWEALALSKSFRLSQETASFVNNAFLGGEQYIEGLRSGEPKPLYVNANLRDIQTLLKLIVPLVRQYGPENSAILAPSVRGNPRLPPLTNALSERYGIPVAVSTSDDVPLDADVVNGKLTVSTYHQFKGMERDLVFVYGADSGYFTFIGRDLPDDRCPNATFVALTRARKQLVILQAEENAPMPFVAAHTLERDGRMINLSQHQMKRQYAPGRPVRYGLLLPAKVWASEAARHVRDEELHVLINRYLRIDKRAALPDHMSIAAPDKVCTNEARNHWEAVSDLNGLSVTAAFEWRFARTMTTFSYRDAAPAIPNDDFEGAVWITREAAKYEAQVSNYKSRLAQMGEHPFDWLVPHLVAATERLKAELEADGALRPDTKVHFEVPLKHKLHIPEPDSLEGQHTQLVGRPDIVHTAGRGRNAAVTIWEIKFVGGLGPEHVIQAVVYGFLWAMRSAAYGMPFPRIVLFNVRDGARWDIETTLEEAGQLIEGVLRAKYTTKGQSPTEVFLSQCEATRKDVEMVVEQFVPRPTKVPDECEGEGEHSEDIGKTTPRRWRKAKDCEPGDVEPLKRRRARKTVAEMR